MHNRAKRNEKEALFTSGQNVLIIQKKEHLTSKQIWPSQIRIEKRKWPEYIDEWRKECERRAV